MEEVSAESLVALLLKKKYNQGESVMIMLRLGQHL